MLLVGHSGGGMPVAQAADRIPDRIARVVYVDSGPLPDGVAQFDTLPPQEQERLRGLDRHRAPAAAARLGSGRRPDQPGRPGRADAGACCAPGPPRSRCGPPPTRCGAPAAVRCRPRWSPAPSRWPWCGR